MNTVPDAATPWSDRGQVHLFEKFDKKFVLDVGSGVVVELDGVAWEILQALQRGETPEAVRGAFADKLGAEAVDRALSELGEFYQVGELFSKDAMQVLPERKQAAVGSLCLILAEDCNLRCEYCFTHGGTYGGDRRMMPADVARAAIDFAFDASGRANALSFSFFGGEPLLNFGVLEETTDYTLARARETGKRVTFNVTSNATLLDGRVRDFYARHPEVSALLSIDGGEAINDRHRKFADGRGSYAKVADHIKAFRDDPRLGRRRFSVRGTYTGVNHEFTQATADLLDLGLTEISIEPAITQNEDIEIKEEHLPAIFAEYDRLARFYLERIKNGEPFSFFHFQHAIDHVASARPMFNPCGAGVGYFGVAADGKLYPCHRFVGDADFAMGDVWKGVTNEKLAELFGSVSINRKEKCRTCWAKYHCGGGCHRHCAEYSDGDIHQPYDLECELMKYRVELGAYLYAALTEEEFSAARRSLPDTLARRPEFDSPRR
jgi:uncharacterized protein